MGDAVVERATTVIEPLQKEARSTYKTVVFRTLYELIQNLELPPGERLVEADLAARFGVSKTPIREALLLLEQEGLVTLVPHAGATVTWPTLEDYEQQLFIQDALEQPALPLVVERITPQELESCAGLIAAAEDAYARRDAPLYHRMLIRMHGELFAAARYPRLMDLIQVVMHAIRRYHPIFVQPFEENWDREFALVRARFEHVRRGDPAAAAAAVQEGHRDMLAFARQLVEREDRSVMRYLAPQRAVSSEFLVSSGSALETHNAQRTALEEGRCI